jgi:hypothetical protein
LTLFRNIILYIGKIPIAEAWKAQEFPRISTHLMMAQ